MDKTREGWQAMLACANENEQNTDIEINREGITLRRAASLLRAQRRSVLRCLDSFWALEVGGALEEPQGQEEPQGPDEPQGQEEPQGPEEPQG